MLWSITKRFMSRASEIGEGATESEAFALDAQLRRLEQVRDAWKSRGLDGGLVPPVPPGPSLGFSSQHHSDPAPSTGNRRLLTSGVL